MELEIRLPYLREIEEAVEVIYLAFTDEFTFLFEKDFDYGKKLFINFYKKMIKKRDLRKFLICKLNNKIVATANLDFEDPHILKFLFYFLKVNIHFLRAYNQLGIKRAIRITMAMYWFFFEDFRRNSCYINLFAVHPEFQNRGIGTKMLQAIESKTRQLHLGSMSLDVAFDDLAARHLYKKFGFVEVRRIRNSIFKHLNDIEVAFSMEKRLDSK